MKFLIASTIAMVIGVIIFMNILNSVQKVDKPGDPNQLNAPATTTVIVDGVPAQVITPPARIIDQLLKESKDPDSSTACISGFGFSTCLTIKETNNDAR